MGAYGRGMFAEGEQTFIDVVGEEKKSWFLSGVSLSRRLKFAELDQLTSCNLDSWLDRMRSTSPVRSFWRWVTAFWVSLICHSLAVMKTVSWFNGQPDVERFLGFTGFMVSLFLGQADDKRIQCFTGFIVSWFYGQPEVKMFQGFMVSLKSCYHMFKVLLV